MRIERVLADAFGPFFNRSLEFAPGMNVLFGPNEAGKSSWHAALYAGLCGRRRGGGSGTKIAQAFVLQHHPWSGEEWTASVVVRLEDGRHVRITQDLGGKIDCTATDVLLGRDVAGEIMGQGAPDGSRFLGLDRDAFLATACVRQADVVKVGDDPKMLQVHIQRAAATRNTDETAAAALAAIDGFRKEHVGRAQVNSTKPLQTAINRVRSSQAALEKTQAGNALRIERERALRAAEDRAEQLRMQVATLEEGLERARLAAMKLELARAEELTRRVPEEPETVRSSSSLDAARNAVAAWKAAPSAVQLEGETAGQLRDRLHALPSTTLTEEEPAATLLHAATAHDNALRDLRNHEQDRPDEIPLVATSALPPADLRELSRILSEPRPPSPGDDLRDRREAAKEAVQRSRSRRTPLLISALVVGFGGVGGFLLEPMVGAVMVVVAMALGVACGVSLSSLAKAERALRLVDSELGDAAYAEQECEGRRRPALDRVEAAGLSSHPEDLRRLADEVEVAAEARKVFASWEQRHGQLVAGVERAADALTEELNSHGVPQGVEAERFGRYVDECKIVRQRRLLQAQLTLRESMEATASARSAAENELREAASACELYAQGEPDSIAASLSAWIDETEVRLKKAQDERNDWTELRTLLGDRSLEDLRTEVKRVSERLTDVPPETALDVPPADMEEQLAHARAEAQLTRQRADTLNGELRSFTSGLASVSDAEEESHAAVQRLERVRDLDRTLELARIYLEKAQDRVHRDIAPIVNATIDAFISRITAGRYTKAAVDPQTLAVRVQDGQGQLRDASLLSHGTAEQIYLLLRVALAEHLTTPEEVCPLILDDVTAQSDATRTQAILEVLHEVSEERQIIFFTQEDGVRDWAMENLHGPQDHFEFIEL